MHASSSSDLAATMSVWFSAFLAIWWFPGAFILTFSGPFVQTGNGYFGSWAAFLFAIMWFVVSEQSLAKRHVQVYTFIWWFTAGRGSTM